MSLTIVEISSNSPDLVMLSGKSYKRDYTELPNGNLPVKLRKQLNLFYHKLSGKDFSLEDNTFIIKADNEVYSRLFGPILKVDENDQNYVIQWGSTLFPLVAENSTFTLNGNPLECEFDLYNFSGRGEDTCLMLYLDGENEGDVIGLPIAVRFSDWNNKLSSKELNSMLKKSPAKIKPYIQRYRKPEKAIIESDFEVDLRDFEIGRSYEVIGYYKCNTQYGINFRVFIKNPDGREGIGIGWVCPSLKNLLNVSPVISEACPAELKIISKKTLNEGKISLKANLVLHPQAVSAEDCNLDLNF